MDCWYTDGEDAQNTGCETREFAPGLQRQRSFCHAAAPATRRDSSLGCSCQRRTRENECSRLPCQQAPALSASVSCNTAQHINKSQTVIPTCKPHSRPASSWLNTVALVIPVTFTFELLTLESIQCMLSAYHGLYIFCLISTVRAVFLSEWRQKHTHSHRRLITRPMPRLAPACAISIL